MSNARASVCLIAPGLLEPFARADAAGRAPARSRVAERLLARAREQALETSGYEHTLMDLAGVNGPGDGDLPVAALTRLADVGDSDRCWWVRSDPVCLHADRDRVLVFGESHLGVAEHEAAALVASLNEHWTDEGWRFDAPTPGRWYLTGPQGSSIGSVTLAELLGRDLGTLMRSSKAPRPAWRRVLNEIQMLLAEHPVNRERQRQGRPAINGVWLWGAGQLPAIDALPWTRVCSDEPLARGLARHGGVRAEDVPQGAVEWLDRAAGKELVVFDRLRDCVLRGDLPGWAEAFDQWVSSWLQPLATALRRRQLAEVELIVPDVGASYRWSPGRVWWPRRRRRLLGGGLSPVQGPEAWR